MRFWVGWWAAVLLGTASAGTAAGVTLALPTGNSRVLGEMLNLMYAVQSDAPADLYAAVVTPAGEALFFEQIGQTPSFSVMPVPFRAAAPAAPAGTQYLLLETTLPQDLPTGDYQFYAAAVAPGANVLDSQQWLGGTYARADLTVFPPAAFFYQTVTPAASVVRAGATGDGATVTAYGTEVVYAKDPANGAGRGDPVISYRAPDRWIMTAWADGAGTPLLYAENTCPQVVTSSIKQLAPLTASGCQSGSGVGVAMGKTSQVFTAPGGEYLLTHTGGEIYLLRLADTADATRTPNQLEGICIRQTPAADLNALAWGEATPVISRAQTAGLLLSDTAIARRRDGTWVLFVKGIDASVNAGCSPGSLCELCARSIYQATSADLLHWSALTPVVTQASVPDAVTYADGTIWLYYQNFGPTCAAQDLRLAQRAPISGVAEQADGRFTAPVTVFFAGASFETDPTEHYPTNANPVALPDAAAWAAYQRCVLPP